MRRIVLLFLIIPAILLLSTCEEFDPQWAGVWVDDTTVPNVVVTLDLKKWEGILTVENSDPEANYPLMIVEGDLSGDEDRMIAEITSVYRKDKDGFEDHYVDPIVIYIFVITPDSVDCPGCLGLDWPLSASYKIEGDTITLTGDLIYALTTELSNTLTATRQ